MSAELPELIGRYRVLARLGAGGMGVVYRAVDPKLQREVAVKLVKLSRAAFSDPLAAEARLLREGQAMARVSHPNVCPVYDVGRCPEGLYIAMELIDGVTLRQWLEAEDRPWRQVLAVMVQAGRGLQAAHAQELVHRDFKPDNVMLGHDGRVRVMDFGLVRAYADPSVDGSTESVAPFSLLDTQLTRDGTVVGTPKYMSPEQHRGGLVDDRSDQFSFCLATHVALFQSELFPASDLQALGRRKAEGPAEVPLRRDVPARLDAILRRGLSPDPAARHPSMAVVLAQLEHDPARLRRRIAMVGLGLATLGITAFVAEPDDPQPCTVALHRFEAAAGEWKRAAPAGPQREAWDAFATAWKDEFDGVCGRASEPVAGREAELDCLAQNVREVEIVREVATEPHAAARALGELGACTGGFGDPAVEAPVRELLVRARVLDAMGQGADAREAADRATRLAASLRLPALEAEGLLQRGLAERTLGELESAEQDLSAAYFASLRGEAERVAGRAAVALTYHYADVSRPSEAAAWARHAETSFGRVDPGPVPRAMYFNAVGRVALARGDWDAAREAFGAGLQLVDREDARPSVAGPLLNNVGMVQAHDGAFEDAIATLEEAVAIIENAYGPDHPTLVGALHNLSTALEGVGEKDRARAAVERALTIADDAPSLSAGKLADVLISVAQFRDEAGESTEVLALLSRARRLIEADYGAFDERLATVASVEGSVLRRRGRLDEARAAMNRAIAIRRETLGDHDLRLAISLIGMANIEGVAGRPDAGLPPAREALSIIEATLPDDHPKRATALLVIARLHHLAGDDNDARPYFISALDVERRRGAPPERVAEITEELDACAKQH